MRNDLSLLVRESASCDLREQRGGADLSRLVGGKSLPVPAIVLRFVSGLGPASAKIFAQTSDLLSFLTIQTLMQCGPEPCLQEWAM